MSTSSRIFWTIVALGLFGAAVALHANPESSHPAPSASISYATAEAEATAWSKAAPGRLVATVEPSGSMVPVLDSRTLLGLESVAPSALRRGDIAVYASLLRPELIVHRVMEVRPDGILMEGDNNRGSDGWIPPSRIRYRVAALFFSSR